MSPSGYLEWLEILKRMGYSHWEAERLIRTRLDGPVPIEGSMFQTVDDDESQFGLGGES